MFTSEKETIRLKASQKGVYAREWIEQAGLKP